MNLDRLTIATRPRRDWEAVDLGILMARRWWWIMTKVWLLVSLPILLLVLVLPLQWLGWVPALLWWLKPLFERPLLLILSQGVFGEQLSTRQVLAACPRLFVQQGVASLTWRRLSPHRSMDLAVVQLEGLKGTARRSRLDVLHRDGHAPAKWLTIIGVHLESFIALALAMAFLVFIPEQVQLRVLDIPFWFESRVGLALQALLFYLSIAAIAPFYVACGFALYLNRRIKLEGWDLEIAFKRMLIKRGLGAPVAALMLCLSGLILPLLPQPIQAQPAEPVPVATEREQVYEQMQEILDGEDFHPKRLQKSLRFKPLDQAEEEDEDDELSMAWLMALGKAITWLFTIIASVAELLLWAVVIGGAAYFALKYRSLLARWRGWPSMRKPKPYQPQSLFGMDVRQESLPDDISACAENLWLQHEHRQALALLYRACLAHLLARGLPLREGTTERECLQLAYSLRQQAQLDASTLTYFEQLTRVWQALAYGHRPPDQQAGLTLCRQWNSHWSGNDYGH